MSSSQSIQSFETLFWSKVRKTDTCWVWTASCHPQGHGYQQFRGKIAYAHRVAWTLVNGEIPAGKHVLHHCDNPPCVRPSHLYVGTHTDNMRDMFRRGRANRAKGERCAGAKLTVEKVKQLRQLRADGMSYTALGAMFKIHPTVAMDVDHRNTWKHVE